MSDRLMPWYEVECLEEAVRENHLLMVEKARRVTELEDENRRLRQALQDAERTLDFQFYDLALQHVRLGLEPGDE